MSKLCFFFLFYTASRTPSLPSSSSLSTGPTTSTGTLCLVIACQLIIIRKRSYIYFSVSRSHHHGDRRGSDRSVVETWPSRALGGFCELGQVWYLQQVISQHLFQLGVGAGWKLRFLLFLVCGGIVYLFILFIFICANSVYLYNFYYKSAFLNKYFMNLFCLICLDCIDCKILFHAFKFQSVVML